MNSLEAVIQTCGCACAAVAPSAKAAASSSKPNNRRIGSFPSGPFTSGCLGCLQQPTPPQQGVGLRLAAAERDIGVLGIARAARRIDVVVQAFCHLGIEDVAGFLERAEGVGIHYLGPHVAVIARRVVIAGEDMAELLRPVP